MGCLRGDHASQRGGHEGPRGENGRHLLSGLLAGVEGILSPMGGKSGARILLRSPTLFGNHRRTHRVRRDEVHPPGRHARHLARFLPHGAGRRNLRAATTAYPGHPGRGVRGDGAQPGARSLLRLGAYPGGRPPCSQNHRRRSFARGRRDGSRSRAGCLPLLPGSIPGDGQ